MSMDIEKAACESSINYKDAYLEAQKAIETMAKIIEEQKRVIRSLSCLYAGDKLN